MSRFAVTILSALAALAIPLTNENIFAQNAGLPQAIDTLAEDTRKEDAMIEEVLRSEAIPKKDKVQYFSQVTKYGFKNLFSNYSYNSTLPYAVQINPNAENFIQDYIRYHSRYLNEMKSWGRPYFNLIESVLQQYGLPRELKYIAVIESNLKTSATSYMGAGGPWQFMPFTARQYGLIVNQYVDDRRDYYKSTHAAARYLLSLYRDLHDWLLVMAAYNGGPGRVYNAIKKSGSRNFWNLQYHLPEESRTYVKRFIATHYIMEGGGGVTTVGGNSSALQSFQNGSKNENIPDSILGSLEMMPISGKYNSLVIAKNLSMELVLFNLLNPDFDIIMSNEGNFKMRLPADKMQLFIANKYQILNECLQVMLGEVSMPVNKTVYPKSKKKKS